VSEHNVHADMFQKQQHLQQVFFNAITVVHTITTT
jgi:hypothetical protein